MTRILAEGYLGEKKSFSQDPWPELYDAMRLGLILQGKVSGIEKGDDGEILVLFIGPIKGVIPEGEIGLAEGQLAQFAVGSTVAFKVKHCDRAAGIAYLSRKEATEEMSSRTWQELKGSAKELMALSKRVSGLYEKLNPTASKDVLTVADEGIAEDEDVEVEGELVVEGEGAEPKEGDDYPDAARITDEEVENIKREIRELRMKMREVGPMRTCVVRHATQYGAYVDIGGVSAFIPRHEISWGFVEDARDLLQSGDAFDVKLIDINDNGVTASIKLLLPDPWESADVKYTKGGIYTGKVVKELTKGMLIELEPGITAFAPHLPFGSPYPGSEVLFKVGRVNSEDRRMNGWVIKVTRRAS